MKKYVILGLAVVIGALAAAWAAERAGYITLPRIPARMPSLSHEVDFSNVSAEGLEESIRGKISTDQETLKKGEDNLEAWLDLAIQYKQAGDIDEAIAVWKYLNDAFPAQQTSSFNLGVVYHQDVKDYPRSEKSYREAVRRSPADILGYLGLHELYRYAYKQDSTAAVDILLEGMKLLPHDPNMPLALAAYYRDDKKDYSKSIEYIRHVIEILETQGDTEKIKALEGEIDRLSQ